MRSVLNKLLAKNRKRHLVNAASPVLGQVATLVSAFVVTPIAVSKLGVSQYGVYVILSTLIGFGGLFTFGVGDATLRLVAKYRALADEEKLKALVQSSLLFFLGMGALCSVLLFLLSVSLLTKVFSVSEDLLAAAEQATKIASLGLFFALPSQVASACIRGYERFDLAAFPSAVLTLLVAVCNVVLLHQGYGLTALAVMIVVSRFMGMIVNLIVACRCVPDIGFLVPRWHWASLKESLGFGLYVWLGTMLNKLRGEGLPLVIGAILGTAATGVFSVASKPVMAVVKLMQYATGFLMPYLTKMYEKGNLKNLEGRYRLASQLAVIAASGACTAIVFSTAPLFDAWLGDSLNTTMIVVAQILAVRFSVLPMASVISQFMRAANRGKTIVLVQGISCLAIIIATAIGAHFGGIVGAAWGQWVVFLTVVFNRCLIEKAVFCAGKVWFQVVLIFGAALPCFIASFFSLDRGYNLAGAIGLSLVVGVLGAVASAFIVGGRDLPRMLNRWHPRTQTAS